MRYLRHLQYDVDYTETQTVGHMPSPGILEDEYRKLRGRVRNLYPRQVFIQSNSADTIYNRSDWVQIYQPMSPGEQAKVEFSEARGCIYIRTGSVRWGR